MNKNMITRLLPFFLACLLTVSCTQTEEESAQVPVGTTEIDVNTHGIPVTDACILYIFKKEGSNPYKLLQNVNLPSGSAIVSLNNADLVAANQFRFLYVSQPTGISNGVTVKKNGGSALAPGDLWTAVRIEAQSQDLNAGIYYKIQDYAGNNLASASPITAILLRLAGQQVIDIYKVDNGDLDDPVAVSGNVYSVLDRVTEIKLTYTGLTKTIAFDEAAGTIQVIDQWGTTYTQTKTLTYETIAGTDFLKVDLTANAIDNSAVKLPDATVVNPAGSARLMGVWGLTATNTVKILAKFSYYHTTPTLCTDSDPATHAHTEACYPKKDKEIGDPNTALFLNIPKPSSTPISIVPNVYTITKAGIRYDRVIDVGVSGGFGFITDWDNGNVGP